MRNLLKIILVAAGLALAGCKSTGNQQPPYWGPTETLSQVAHAVNANNRPIQTIWARHDFDALIYDDKGKSHSLSGSGTLLFRRPGDLLLQASGVVNFFEAGANPEHFWFTVYPKEVSTQWWGLRENVEAAGATRMPIRPDLLIEVLGISIINDNFLVPPVPVMRFNNDQWAYMLVWQSPVPDRWIALKEVWYDLQTKHPKLILLFDPNGRIITRAYLSEYAKIQGMTSEMATKFDLFFPENKSQLSFKITDLRQYLEKRVVNKTIKFPNDASFAFPEDPGVEKRVEIK